MKSDFDKKKEKIEMLEKAKDLADTYQEKLSIQHEINRLKNE